MAGLFVYPPFFTAKLFHQDSNSDSLAVRRQCAWASGVMPLSWHVATLPYHWLVAIGGLFCWTLHSHVPWHPENYEKTKACMKSLNWSKSCTQTPHMIPNQTRLWNVYLVFQTHLKDKTSIYILLILSSYMLVLYNYEATALQLPAFQHENTNRDTLLGLRVSVDLVTKWCTNCVQW